MNLDDITPLILTYNEEANIARTLAALHWARRIVVVDSGSTDATLEILKADARVEVVHRKFDDFASQCNFGLTLVGTPFTLSLDADHVMTPELTREIEALDPGSDAGWRIPFRYCVNGRPLRSSLLPPRTSLFRTCSAHYEQDGHAHQVVIRGEVRDLVACLLHDDRKPLERWCQVQKTYAVIEAVKLRSIPMLALDWPDRARRLFLGPFLVLPYCLLWKGLILDGRRGWFYTGQRFYAEALLAGCLIAAGFKQGAPPGNFN